jgi:hypothetical protein
MAAMLTATGNREQRFINGFRIDAHPSVSAIAYAGRVNRTFVPVSEGGLELTDSVFRLLRHRSHHQAGSGN